MERYNLYCALQRVQSNKGGAGVGGMFVDALPAFLKEHWPSIKVQLLEGSYQPKPGGGIRKLGASTVLDRFVQQALLQILQLEWDRSFSHFSFGFRPNRSSHHAIARSQRFINEGCCWTVDMDLEKFFDRVNHDKIS